MTITSAMRTLNTSSCLQAKKYNEKHEWVEPMEEGGTVRVGITHYAAEALGDVVYVELPEDGKKVKQGEEVGALESVKAASELYSPVTGLVVGPNPTVMDKPATLNKDPEGEGWLFKLKPSNTGEMEGLMDTEGYLKFLSSQTEDLD